jgi:hypothetical protein
MLVKLLSISAAMILPLCAVMAQADKPPAAVVAGIPVNYDESRVGTYTLPDPLVLAGGKPVRDANTWNEQRRAEIVRLFEENQYGRCPGRPAAMRFDVFDKGTPASASPRSMTATSIRIFPAASPTGYARSI